MKKYILVFAFILFNCSLSVAQTGFFGQARFNRYGDWGIDVGANFTKVLGIRAGIMTDIDRIGIKDGRDVNAYKEVLGNNYRLSYSIGPMVRCADWLWVSATAGYGEIGTYAYNSLTDVYGISGKIKGLEAGFQLQFRLSVMTFELGYGTIAKSFSLGKPYHDITFGIGIYI